MSSKRTPYSSPELIPSTVMKLIAIGVPHHWRKSHHDIEVSCPRCGTGARLILDEEEPWHLCLGKFGCPVDRMPFPQVLEALRASLSNPPRRSIQLACDGGVGITSRPTISVRRFRRTPSADIRRNGIEKAGTVLCRILGNLHQSLTPFRRSLNSWEMLAP